MLGVSVKSFSKWTNWRLPLQPHHFYSLCARAASCVKKFLSRVRFPRVRSELASISSAVQPPLNSSSVCLQSFCNGTLKGRNHIEGCCFNCCFPVSHNFKVLSHKFYFWSYTSHLPCIIFLNHVLPLFFFFSHLQIVAWLNNSEHFFLVSGTNNF